MMFKDIPMHTKPLKHAKYIEILRHSLNKHDSSKNLYAFRKPQQMQSVFLDVFYNLKLP